MHLWLMIFDKIHWNTNFRFAHGYQREYPYNDTQVTFYKYIMGISKLNSRLRNLDHLSLRHGGPPSLYITVTS